MICNLIYNRPEAEPNRNYIDFYRRACTRRGVGFYLLYKEDIDSGGIPLPDHGFVINRTRDAALAALLEQKGLPVFNNSRITRLGNDKLLCLRYVEQQGLPILKTSEHFEDLTHFPVVVKSRDGHGGTEVFLIGSYEEALRFQEKTACDPPGKWIWQEIADTPGKDLRVYVTGDRITAAMLRSSDTDFRSNYCLGGKASIYTLSSEEEKTVKKIMSGLSIGHCGIDFLFHQGQIIFNELEDVVGSRMLYTFTDIDVVEEYVDHILSTLP